MPHEQPVHVSGFDLDERISVAHRENDVNEIQVSLNIGLTLS
eukprot:SAG11_NODE_2176_length_3717_cov_2.881426_3_plen_42_part_00